MLQPSTWAQVAELQAAIERLESENKTQADQIKALKEQNTSLTATKREKGKKAAREEFEFDESNTADFENPNKKRSAFKALDAALRREFGPVVGRRAEGGDPTTTTTASVTKRNILIQRGGKQKRWSTSRPTGWWRVRS